MTWNTLEKETIVKFAAPHDTYWPGQFVVTDGPYIYGPGGGEKYTVERPVTRYGTTIGVPRSVLIPLYMLPS